jgi:integrase
MARPAPKKLRGIYEKVKGSGVWWICWFDSNGNRHREKAGTREAATNLYRKRKTEALQGKKLPEMLRRNAVTFGDLAEKVRQHADNNEKEKAYSPRYAAIVRQEAKKLESWWGNRAADSLTPSEIEAKLSEYAKTPATFNRWKSTLSLAYQLGMANGLVQFNPARIVSHKRENNARLRYLSDDEEAKLRKIIRERFSSREPEFDLALYTGMRRSEQYGLLWRNVDFTTGLITIPQSKHGKVRYVRINALAKFALQGLLPFRCGDDSPVCPGGMTRSGYRDRWFFECASKAGLVGVIWHTLRHTFITRAVRNRVPIEEVQELAGHKTITMTIRYTHLDPDYLREAAEKAVAPVGTATKSATGEQEQPQIKSAYLQ